MTAILWTLCALLIATPCYAGVLATDNFNRANENPLSGWTTITDEWPLQIIADQVRGTVTFENNGAYYTAVTPPDDHYSQIRIATGTSNSVAPAVRVATGAATYYAANAQVSPPFADLYKIVGTSYTSLSTASTSLATNDIIRLTVIGSDLTMYQNGVPILTATDNAITSGRFGIYINTGGTLSNTEFDDFEGGDFSLPSGSGNARRRGGAVD